MDFSDLVTREIDERFCYIKYDTFELIMMKDNNYINATKLCKLEGKDFHRWKRLEGTKELIEEIKRINNVWKIKSVPQDLGVPEVIITVEPEDKSDKKYEVAGSYIHQDLLYHITSWISPSFSVKVSKIVNCYIYGKYEFKVKEKENKIDELMELLYKFNDKYDKDTAKLDKYNKLMEEKYDRDIAETRELYRGQHEEVKELKKHNNYLIPLNV
ncbi:SWPV2-ORF209 [Shearwaterpox virus]|uniref:SWPV2-ORF209 n=1 Tax=Shearwaterpox virus TaxID=1974596 RepID=A0A1V0QGI5_CNPV|nr:SWPV2-ORF209 [Shearwaterpox virus]